jgi:hypothetical protein
MLTGQPTAATGLPIDPILPILGHAGKRFVRRQDLWASVTAHVKIRNDSAGLTHSNSLFGS